MATKAEIIKFLASDYPYTNCTVEAVGDKSATVKRQVGANDLRPGGTMIEIIDGSILLNFILQESDNLIDWFDTAEICPVILLAPDPGTKFYRFGAGVMP